MDPPPSKKKKHVPPFSIYLPNYFNQQPGKLAMYWRQLHFEKCETEIYIIRVTVAPEISFPTL
jgi:hypothetical protein